MVGVVDLVDLLNEIDDGKEKGESSGTVTVDVESIWLVFDYINALRKRVKELEMNVNG